MGQYMLYALATATLLEINLPDWHQGICLEMLWCCAALKGEIKLDEDETHYEGLDYGNGRTMGIGNGIVDTCLFWCYFRRALPIIAFERKGLSQTYSISYM
jgi:hypothetical protein